MTRNEIDARREAAMLEHFAAGAALDSAESWANRDTVSCEEYGAVLSRYRAAADALEAVQSADRELAREERAARARTKTAAMIRSVSPARLAEMDRRGY